MKVEEEKELWGFCASVNEVVRDLAGGASREGWRWKQYATCAWRWVQGKECSILRLTECSVLANVVWFNMFSGLGQCWNVDKETAVWISHLCINKQNLCLWEWVPFWKETRKTNTWPESWRYNVLQKNHALDINICKVKGKLLMGTIKVWEEQKKEIWRRERGWWGNKGVDRARKEGQ